MSKSMRRVRSFRVLYVLPTTVLLLGVVAPLIAGLETLHLRDVFVTHLPFKASQDRLLEAGRLLPLVDPWRDGQALLGNPNALTLYPTSAFLAVAGPIWTLNAHFWLHWLLAPWAGLWLGRAWGLSRPGAWCLGVVYAASGYFLSLMNLYNMVAGAVLAPAFVAACLRATALRASPRHPAQAGAASTARRLWVAVAGLWALLVLGGDPMIGVASLALALSALLIRSPSLAALRRPILSLIGAIVAGSLVALPQVVETLRILPRSIRGYMSFDPTTVLAFSWAPASAPELVLPMVFGGGTVPFWASGTFGRQWPLILSLSLGWIALALAACASFRRPAARWSVLWIGLGVFFALGHHNPVVPRLLELDLPGTSLIRYPERLWVLPTLGASILAGLGFEAVFLRRAGGGRERRYRRLLIAGFSLFALALGGLLIPGAPTLRLLATYAEGGELVDPQLTTVAAHWIRTWLLVMGSIAAAWLLVLGRRHEPRLAAAATLVVHLGSQLLLLAPLLDRDVSAIYRTPPPVVDLLPPEALVVSADGERLFEDDQDPETLLRRDLLGPRGARERHVSGYWSYGPLWDRTYALSLSAERLDSFYTMAIARSFLLATDSQRARLLRASGVDRLILIRPLRGADAQARPIAAFESLVRRYFVYELLDPAPSRFVATRVWDAPDMSSAVDLMARDSFDPASHVLLPASADGPRSSGGGTVDLLHHTVERTELEVETPEAGVVVFARRTWLPIWRARVDGEDTEVLVANVHRMAVEVPPGRHRVELFVDRRPTRIAVAVSLLAVLGLLALAVAPSRRSTADRPGTSP